ncbi:MAG: hypothetical protein HUU15_05685 [Candidatus Brocadiae bacterium]|nr:hypothetical protein [Candidatus Brocadiia bacterium]
MPPPAPARTLAPWAIAGALALSPGCGAEDPPVGDPPDPTDDLDPGEVLVMGLRPSDVAVDLATVLPLKPHAIADDGGRYDLPLDEVTYEVDDDAVAWVDPEGRLIPLAVGTATVTPTWEEVRGEPAVVRVVPPGELRVRVVDAATDLPLPAASVWVGDGAPSGPWFTDGGGEVTVQGQFSGRVTITADFDGYRRTSLCDVAAREVRIALREDGQPPPSCTVGGGVRFEAEPGPGEMALALSVATIDGSPILGNLGDFIGELEEVEAFGLTASLPQNMVVTGVDEHYELPAVEGQRRVVTLGGIFDVGVLLQLAAQIEEIGLGAVFQVLGQHTAELRFGASDPLPLEPGTYRDGVEVSAGIPLSREVHALVGPPPPGDFPDPATLLSLRDGGEVGWLVSGLGVGLNVYPDPGDDDTTGDDDDDATFERPLPRAADGWEDVAIHEADPSVDGPFAAPTSRYLASIFEHGLGGGGRASIVLSTAVSDDSLVLPAFLGLPELHAPTPEESARGVLGWAADPAATAQVLTLTGSERWWDLWVAGGVGEVVVPTGLPTLGDDPDSEARFWLHNAYGAVVASFDSLANDADEGLPDLPHLLQRRTDALISWWDPLFP